MFMLDCPLTEEPHRVSSSWALHWNTSYKMKIGGSVRTHAPEETNRATAALSQACSGNLETDPEHAREWLILDVDTPLLWIIRPDGHQTYSAQCLTGPPRGCSKKSKKWSRCSRHFLSVNLIHLLAFTSLAFTTPGALGLTFHDFDRVSRSPSSTCTASPPATASFRSLCLHLSGLSLG